MLDEGLNVCPVGSAIDLQEECPVLKSWCEVFLLETSMFSLCMRGVSPGTLASNMYVRLIDLSQLPLGVCVYAFFCLIVSLCNPVMK